MKKLIVQGFLVVGALTIAMRPAVANEASKAETAGVASGVAIGAVLGGPVGAVAGTLLGRFVGKKAHQAKMAGDLRRDLSVAEAQIERLRNELDLSSAELLAYQATAETEAKSLALELEILFPTDVSQLSPSAKERVEKLAALLNEMPDLRVQLDGYADQRGAEEHNEALSLARTTEVRNLLIGYGVKESRIQSSAHGERMSRAQDGDTDAYALERRVSIRLSADNESTQVARQNQ